MTTYQIIAYPAGERTVVATLPGFPPHREADLRVVMLVATGSQNIGSEADGIIAQAQVHAKLRGEYVDVLRDGVEIATVGPEGVV